MGRKCSEKESSRHWGCECNSNNKLLWDTSENSSIGITWPLGVWGWIFFGLPRDISCAVPGEGCSKGAGEKHWAGVDVHQSLQLKAVLLSLTSRGDLHHVPSKQPSPLPNSNSAAYSSWGGSLLIISSTFPVLSWPLCNYINLLPCLEVPYYRDLLRLD